MDIEWQWIAGIGLPVAALFFALWWKVESRQDKAIGDLRQCNHADHKEIRNEIADTKEMINEQHHHIRDKLDNMWRHISKMREGHHGD